MKKILYFSLLLVCIACNVESERNPKEYLKDVAKHLGKDKMNNTTVTFDVNDMIYESKRTGNGYHFSMTRTLDTTTFQAKAYNGGFEYTENGIPKNYGFQNLQVEKQLLAINHFMEIPMLFIDDNSAIITQKNPVIIDNKNYLLFHVKYESLMPTDLISNYYLYIQKKEQTVDFIGYDFAPAEDRLFFRESFNRRTVEGIVFEDYRTFRTKTNGVVMDSLPILFLRNELDLTAAFKPENIKVSLND
ncbi:MAG: hypothetical protein ACI86L_000857 [Dokdonia sp.]|jgi:hypothetical protein